MEYGQKSLKAIHHQMNKMKNIIGKLIKKINETREENTTLKKYLRDIAIECKLENIDTMKEEDVYEKIKESIKYQKDIIDIVNNNLEQVKDKVIDLNTK